MYTDLELSNKDECVSACKLDAPQVSSDIKKYVRKNTFTYYVGINTWLHIVKECDAYGWIAVKDYVIKHGLIHTIKLCDDDATLLVQGSEPASDIGKLLYAMSGFRVKSIALHPERNFGKDALSTALQLLRYLKRFSPLENDKVKEKTLLDFIQTENRNKQLQRKEYPQYIIGLVKHELANVLDWDGIVNWIQDMDKYRFTPTSGTSAEGCKSLGEKIAEIAAVHPDCFVQPMGLPYVVPFWKEDKDVDTSTVLAVPKSYKSSRIIAMEPVYRQAVCNEISRYLQSCLPDCVDVRDQSRNQMLAQQGSRANTLATLDASHASDTITKTLFREIFPRDFVRVVDPLLSHYTEIGRRKRVMQMCSTAGHSLTFIIETLVYYAVAMAASNMAARFTGHTGAPLVSVYGDDVIVETWCASTVIEFYSVLGFIINEDKSYLSGHYRESCGEEYWDGINVTSTYYPRFPVIGTLDKVVSLGTRMYRDSYRGKIDDSTTMLIDLHKRLFHISYGASTFVKEIIKSARPKLTSSVFGSDRPDLWDYVEIAPTLEPKGYSVDGSEVTLSPEVVSACKTTRHSYASLRYTGPVEITESALRAFDIYKYQKFLRSGPAYSDPLLKLLGISDKPMTVREAFGEGRLVWSYFKI